MYLINTYSNKGETIVDNCVGSGTTALSCKILKRNYLCCDTNQEYIDIAKERLKGVGGLLEYEGIR